MSADANPSPRTALAARSEEATALVVRSEVPLGLQYAEYKQYLRVDFFHSCAYCTIAESEARAIRFTIDHYEPQNARSDLVNEYSNLMYCCEVCNTYKGDRVPPQAAREAGHRFFRPDQDVRKEHFERRGRHLEHKTPVGFYTIETLDLNRQNLRRLRDLRERVLECDKYVVEGIMALRAYPIDFLPAEMRHKANERIKDAMLAAEELVEEIDAVLREHAGSPLVDPDLDAGERSATRAKKLKELEAMYPGGRWRAPRAPRRTHGKKTIPR